MSKIIDFELNLTEIWPKQNKSILGEASEALSTHHVLHLTSVESFFVHLI